MGVNCCCLLINYIVYKHFDRSLHVGSSDPTCVQNFRPIALTVFEIQCILDYPNELNGRLCHCKYASTHAQLTYFCGRGRFLHCALFAQLQTDRSCEFYRGYDKVKMLLKALSKINDKASIVKQLKSSSVADCYGL